MLYATEYQILEPATVSVLNRGVPVEREPLRVAILLNEQRFSAEHGLMAHRETVFFLDRMHDWNHHNGRLRYHSIQCDQPIGLVVVFAETDRLYCPMCGQRVHPVLDCVCQLEARHAK